MPEPYFHGKMDFAKMIKQKSEPCSSLFSQVPPRNGCDCRSRDRGAEKFDDVLEMEKLGQEVKAASEAGMCQKNGLFLAASRRKEAFLTVDFQFCEHSSDRALQNTRY